MSQPAAPSAPLDPDAPGLSPPEALLSLTGPAEIGAEQFFHVFHLGAQGFLLEPGTPAEMTELPPMTRLPFSAPWFEGLVNFRGDLLPVFDPQRFLFPDIGPGRGRYLLVLGDEAGRAALRADQVQALMITAEQMLTPCDPPALNEPAIDLVLGARRYGEDTFLQLDLERLLERLSEPPAA